MSEWDFAFGLTGQALEDALSSGATYEEWAVINRQLEQEFMGTDGKDMFVFIDAENVPSKFWEEIEYRLAYLVDRRSVKIYARQKDHATIGWHRVSNSRESIKEIRLSGGPSKNKVDAKIIKDIRRLLHRCNPDETCVVIVSSDSDYKGIVSELKQSGVWVIGIGEAKTKQNYRDALNRFIELESWEFDGDYSAPSIARHVTYCNKCREAL